MNSYIKLLVITTFALWKIDGMAVCAGTPNIAIDISQIDMGKVVKSTGAADIDLSAYGVRTVSGTQGLSSTFTIGKVTVTGTANCSFLITQTPVSGFSVSPVYYNATTSGCGASGSDGGSGVTGNLGAGGTCAIDVGAKVLSIDSSVSTGEIAKFKLTVSYN